MDDRARAILIPTTIKAGANWQEFLGREGYAVTSA
jgi:hypothetical protein